MYDISLNDKYINFKELEKIIYKHACDLGCELMKEVLEKLDDKLMKERDTEKYRNKGLKKTCLRTIMGNVEYSRRIYQFTMKMVKLLVNIYLMNI